MGKKALYIYSLVVQDVQQGEAMEEIRWDAWASLTEQNYVPYVKSNKREASWETTRTFSGDAGNRRDVENLNIWRNIGWIPKSALELQEGSKQARKPLTRVRGVLMEQIECWKPRKGDRDIQLQVF